MLTGIILALLYPFSDVVHWAKWLASVFAIRLWRRMHRGRFDLYDFKSVDNPPEKLAVLVPEEERVLESPFPEDHLYEAADEIFIYGVNSKSESLVVRVARAPNDESEAWIYLKLKDGRCYEMQKRGGHQRNYGGNCTSFTCDGLQMHYLSPMRRWRIVYCGMLREKSQNEDADDKEVFVKFIFLWKSSSDVFDHASDIHVGITASAMANATWTSLIPPVDKVSEVMNFYSQSGVIDGTVSIDDEPELEMYLFGERIRFLGKYSCSVGCKFKHIIGVTPASGLIVHLAKTSVPNILHNLYSGFIVHPSSFLRVIEDGVIISKMSKDANVRAPRLTATFQAGRQYELVGDSVGEDVRFKSEQGWNGHLEMTEIEFEINGIKGSGFMLSGEILRLPERKPQKIPPVLPTEKPLTVRFTDVESHTTELTGGKGSSLGVLTQLSGILSSQFVVPKGIVVTTAAYEKFLTTEILEKIERLKNVAYGNVEGSTQEACKIVTSALERARLPDKIAKDIEEQLIRIFPTNLKYRKFAVRSSATGEDTDQMSAAGQMDTFLGIQGLNEILTAVKKCWASQFAYIATEYKRQNGQILNSPMAVVIQEMVECEAAGVLFTCDPVTSNPSVAVLTGNYGLGESVVSGCEEPDTIVLKKLLSKDVEIISSNIGLKQRRIVMTGTIPEEGEDAVITEAVPEDKRNECCVSREMVLRLGKLSLKIEDYFKSPRDIEWGIKNDKIFILQSRPVTTGSGTTDYEMKHDMDGPLRNENDFFTVSNIGEVMPGATTPISSDIILRIFTSVYKRRRVGQKQSSSFLLHKYFPCGVAPHLLHQTINVLDGLSSVGDIDSMQAKAFMIGIFGHDLDDPELKVMAKHRKDTEIETNSTFSLNYYKNLFFCGWGLEKVKKEIFAYQVPAENGRTAQETFRLLMRSTSPAAEQYLLQVLTLETSLIWNMHVFLSLGKAKGSIDNDVYGDFAKLLATSSNVESADIPSAIKEVARWIAKAMKSEDFKSMTIEEAEEWLKTSTSSAGVKFREFLKRHGHRCIKEFDMYSNPWRENPKPLIELLQNMAGSKEVTSEKKEEDISTIISKLAVPVNWKTKLYLKFLVPNCRRAVRDREAAKSLCIKAFDNLRKGFQHLSKLMVAEGYLPDRSLLYFFALDDLEELLRTRNPKLIARAVHRRKLFPILDSYKFPEIWKGCPIPINEEEDEDVEYLADFTMTGFPVSQGVVRGYARVAHSLEEATHLKPGEILITYSTDVGWSPYFPILTGVVTELGGLISHGAVVSREYGLPCVVGLHGATKHFRTGDYVLLDGNKGILQRLTPPEK